MPEMRPGGDENHCRSAQVGAGFALDRKHQASELISIAANGSSKASQIEVKAKIKNRIFLGEHTEYLVEAAGFGEILVLAPKKEERGSGGFAPGDDVVVGWNENAALVLADN